MRQGYVFYFSAITKLEIFPGATPAQLEFLNNVLQAITIILLDEPAVDKAVEINTDLKRKRKQLILADLIIASTPVFHKLPFHIE